MGYGLKGCSIEVRSGRGGKELRTQVSQVWGDGTELPPQTPHTLHFHTAPHPTLSRRSTPHDPHLCRAPSVASAWPSSSTSSVIPNCSTRHRATHPPCPPLAPGPRQLAEAGGRALGAPSSAVVPSRGPRARRQSACRRPVIPACRTPHFPHRPHP